MRCGVPDCNNRASFKLKRIIDPFGFHANMEEMYICDQCYENENPNHKNMLIFSPEEIKDELQMRGWIVDEKLTFMKRYKRIRH